MDGGVERTLPTGGRVPVDVAVAVVPAQREVLFALALEGSGPGDDGVGWVTFAY